jgi:hypothetical protein
MVLFDKLSFSQVVGVFQAFKLYYERSVSKQPLGVDSAGEAKQSESSMEFSLCVNEKLSVVEEPSNEVPGNELPR